MIYHHIFVFFFQKRLSATAIKFYSKYYKKNYLKLLLWLLYITSNNLSQRKIIEECFQARKFLILILNSSSFSKSRMFLPRGCRNPVCIHTRSQTSTSIRILYEHMIKPTSSNAYK